MIAALASPVFSEITMILGAIVATLVAVPLISALAFILGGLIVAAALVVFILIASLAVRMVKRKQSARSRDPYAEAFGDYPRPVAFHCVNDGRRTEIIPLDLRRLRQ